MAGFIGRALTAYEQRVFAFMDGRSYTAGHGAALARAACTEEYEAVIARAVERYEDWLTDGEVA